MAKNLTESLQMFDYKVDSSSNSAILCTLKGYMTYHDKANRNRRKYPNGFWQRQVDSERIKEMLDTKTLFGEAKHPGKDDSPMVELPNVSHSVRAIKIDDTGVFGTIDILNTTQGRAIKTLVDYGSKLGISTRAFGKQTEDKDGNYIPDEENYLLVTWDLVTFPAFSDARMQLTDGAEIDITDAIPVSKKQILDKLATLPENDARALCDATGIAYVPAKDQEIADLCSQLDEAAGRIAALESKMASGAEDLPTDEQVEATEEEKNDKTGLPHLAALLADGVAAKKQINDYLRLRTASIKEFDEVSKIALSQKDEIKSLRAANVQLGDALEKTRTQLSEVTHHRDELELLANRVIDEFEESVEDLQSEINDRDEKLQTLQLQLDHTEEQIRDLMVGQRRIPRGELKDSTRTTAPEKRPNHTLYEALVDESTVGATTNLRLMVNKLSKRG